PCPNPFPYTTLFRSEASNRIETGGETHFLKSCSPVEDDCGGGLSCVCGICTVTCDDDAMCSQFPGATCVAESAGRCGQPEPAGRDRKSTRLNSSHVK